MSTSPEAHISEEELAAQFKAGEERAIRYMFRHYSGPLYAVIFKLLPHEETATNLLQDTFVKAWQSAHSYNSSQGYLYTWLLSIARSLTLAHKTATGFKAEPVAQPQAAVRPVGNKDQNQDQGIESLDMRGMTERLRPEQKELLDLTYFNGYSPAEASQKLRIPVGTIKNRVRASVLELRKIFKL